MAASRVMRVDEQVWAELQKRATPLDGSPNAVMRRLLGLPEEKDTSADYIDPRVTGVLEAMRELIGETPKVSLSEHDYSLLSGSGNLIAHIRSQRGPLRITAGKQLAERAGIHDWENEIQTSRSFGGRTVRWYIPNGDAAANKRVANFLAGLWRSGTLAPPVDAKPLVHAQ